MNTPDSPVTIAMHTRHLGTSEGELVKQMLEGFD